MKVLLAVVGFMVFMCAIELGIFLCYFIKAKISGQAVPSSNDRVDAGTILVILIMGLAVFMLIGELYKWLSG